MLLCHQAASQVNNRTLSSGPQHPPDTDSDGFKRFGAVTHRLGDDCVLKRRNILNARRMVADTCVCYAPDRLNNRISHSVTEMCTTCSGASLCYGTMSERDAVPQITTRLKLCPVAMRLLHVGTVRQVDTASHRIRPWLRLEPR